MQINPFIRNDRGRRGIQNIPIKNADILETFVFLAIYKSLSNRSSTMLSVPFCTIHSYRPLLLFFSDTYIKNILATSVFSKPLLTDSTDSTAQTASTMDGTPLFRIRKQSKRRIYLSLIPSFRPISDWLSARLPKKVQRATLE